jgi:hypothetical protein
LTIATCLDHHALVGREFLHRVFSPNGFHPDPDFFTDMMQECSEPAYITGGVLFISAGIVLSVWGMMVRFPFATTIRTTVALGVAGVAIPLAVPFIFWMWGTILLTVR